MAREWALRGVSEEELKSNNKSDSPKTPKGKWDNYWYHYKWLTIGGLFAVIVLSVMIGQIIMRDDPDYRIVIATQEYVSDKAVQRLQEVFEQYGRDIDQDGKVEVRVETITLTGDMQMGMANQTKLIANFSAGDVMFYIFDKESFEANVKAQQTDEFRFFAPLGLDIDGIDQQDNFWNWKDHPLSEEDSMKGLPENLYFGVRSVSGTAANKKSRQLHEQSMDLLKAFLTDSPLSEQE